MNFSILQNIIILKYCFLILIICKIFYFIVELVYKYIYNIFKLRMLYLKLGCEIMIGIIGAMKVEVEYILEKLENKTTEVVSEILFTKGTLSGTEIVIAACSPGKVNAAITAQTMIIKYNPDIIINTGCAGSLSKDASIGSVVVATGAVYSMT